MPEPEHDIITVIVPVHFTRADVRNANWPALRQALIENLLDAANEVIDHELQQRGLA
jgi:hypothetical protein